MTIQEGRNAKQPTSSSTTSHLTSNNTSNSRSNGGAVLSAFFGSLTAAGASARSASHTTSDQPESPQQAIQAPVVEEAVVALDNNNQSQQQQQQQQSQLQQYRVEQRPLQNGCEDKWSWSKRDRSKEVWLSGANNRTVHFHPNWSKGTAGIRGTRVLNNGRYYWELSVSQRVFGTRINTPHGKLIQKMHHPLSQQTGEGALRLLLPCCAVLCGARGTQIKEREKKSISSSGRRQQRMRCRAGSLYLMLRWCCCYQHMTKQKGPRI